MRKIIALLLLVVITISVTLGVTWLVHYKTTFPVPKYRSDVEFSTAIARSTPTLVSKSGQPIFTITRVKKLTANWYLISVRQKNAPDDAIVSKIVINDPYYSSSYINVVSGPSISFSKQGLYKSDVPDNIIKELTQ